MTGKILIVDNEQDMLALLRRIITEETKHELTTESDPLKGLKLFRQHTFDLVITDLRMPEMDGITFLEEVKRIRPAAHVIILTAYATIETAVEAIQKGAFDYITKPFRRERMLLTIDRVMKWQEMERENLALRQALSEKGEISFIVGSTPPMNEMYKRILQVAPTSATVLITGASGTGKEMVARLIHRSSLRSSNKFVAVNCNAIPEQVIESELFGHVRGAFTGATRDKRGLVEYANEGTLFLDEIGDLTLGLQTKLLRLLQEGEYKPVGNEITKKADVRFIAATSRNLADDIAEKRFSEALYYRLNVIRFEMPPLEHRKQDVPMLSHHFLKRFTALHRKSIQKISPAAMETFMAYKFPGNIRELENIIERGVIFCSTDTLEVNDLFLDDDYKSYFADLDQDIASMSFKDAKEKMIGIFHKQYVQLLLQKSNGNITRAAEIAGIQRQYLHRLMKESGIDSGDFRPEP
jgi:DNA-binding NtrC family response regulator